MLFEKEKPLWCLRVVVLRAGRQAGDCDIRVYIEWDLLAWMFADFEMVLACVWCITTPHEYYTSLPSPREGGGPCGDNELFVLVDTEILWDQHSAVGSFLSHC